MTEDTPITAEELQNKLQNIDLEQVIINDLIKQLKQTHQEQLTSVLMHPDAYKALTDFKNQNALQRFAWNIKWGFKDCLDNFINWKGHMKGEDWDFWEILNGEWGNWE
jgi:hypothetical protein